MNRRSRRGRASVLSLALGSGIAGCASTGGGAGASGVPGVPGRAEAEEKSAFLAVVLAVFPGVFVHGLGNLYANRTDRAEELMAEEGIGVGALGIGAGLGYLGYEEHLHADHSKGFEQVLGRVEESGEFLGAAGGLGLGLAFFLDSWIRDIAEAPGAVERHNKDTKRLYDDSIHLVGADTAVETTAGAPSAPPDRRATDVAGWPPAPTSLPAAGDSRKP